MRIKKLTLALAMLPCLAACGPSVYTLDVDFRNASVSGLDFTGRSVGIVYVYGAQEGDSLLVSEIAENLATGLEQSYNNGEAVIPFYTLPYTPGADYSNRDTLVNYVVSLDHDVLFLISDADVEKESAAVNLFYTMDQNDDVWVYKNIGKNSNLASQFEPIWTREGHRIYYYDNEKWLEAADAAVAFEFSTALEKFLSLSDEGSAERMSSAAFDLAYCCYMLGEYDLALEWLDQSDAYYTLPGSSTLKRQITERQKKDSKR